MNDYPTKQTLKCIKNFNLGKRPLKILLDLIRTEWKFADVEYYKLIIKGNNVYLELHTGGWSGNEEIYDSFEKIKMIAMFWQKSERGGHYYYTFPKFMYEKGFKTTLEDETK